MLFKDRVPFVLGFNQVNANVNTIPVASSAIAVPMVTTVTRPLLLVPKMLASLVHVLMVPSAWKHFSLWTSTS